MLFQPGIFTCTNAFKISNLIPSPDRLNKQLRFKAGGGASIIKRQSVERGVCRETLAVRETRLLLQ